MLQSLLIVVLEWVKRYLNTFCLTGYDWSKRDIRNHVTIIQSIHFLAIQRPEGTSPLILTNGSPEVWLNKHNDVCRVNMSKKGWHENVTSQPVADGWHDLMDLCVFFGDEIPGFRLGIYVGYCVSHHNLRTEIHFISSQKEDSKGEKKGGSRNGIFIERRKKTLRVDTFCGKFGITLLPLLPCFTSRCI